MPRYDNLSADQLETIRKFIEEAESIDAGNPRELEDLRALVEKHWPHLLHKTASAHSTLTGSFEAVGRCASISRTLSEDVHARAHHQIAVRSRFHASSKAAMGIGCNRSGERALRLFHRADQSGPNEA
jgi:hypothetical protein